MSRMTTKARRARRSRRSIYAVKVWLVACRAAIAAGEPNLPTFVLAVEWNGRKVTS